MRHEVKTTTESIHRIKLTGKDIVELVSKQFNIPINVDVEVNVMVPNDSRRCGTELDIDDATPVQIIWHTNERIES